MRDGWPSFRATLDAIRWQVFSRLTGSLSALYDDRLVPPPQPPGDERAPPPEDHGPDAASYHAIYRCRKNRPVVRRVEVRNTCMVLNLLRIELLSRVRAAATIKTLETRY
jgi:phosphoenolpyruvate carboxylase